MKIPFSSDSFGILTNMAGAVYSRITLKAVQYYIRLSLDLCTIQEPAAFNCLILLGHRE